MQPRPLQLLADSKKTPRPLELELESPPCDAATTDCLTIEPASLQVVDRELKAALAAAAQSPEVRADTNAGINAIQPVPQRCQGSADSFWVDVSRTEACARAAYRLNVRQKINGVDTIVGTMNFVATFYVYSSTTLATWAHQVQITPTSLTGEAPGTSYSAVSACNIVPGWQSGACGIDAATTIPTQPMIVGRTVAAEAFYTFRGSNLSTGRGAWRLSFTHPTATPVATNLYASNVRCDTQATTTPGCVNPYFDPTITYSRAAVPQFARHVEAAQASGLPGLSTPLHRIVDEIDIRKNGDKACPASLPRPKTPYAHECDEYPFRSTYEGAYTGGGYTIYPRTHSWCQVSLAGQTTSLGPMGYSICMIKDTDNSRAGGLLGSFYRSQRVLHMDAFYVRFGA
ncbi:NucA/NucB deoxyribonuclease domain-containing protein [Cellulomonas algicola]|uniref:NucA/NucB deoxyribonuclease domain-containing protein n=1 Tax=Cellulomonas algicola TaxID=2071633 RepID=UPI000F55EA37|nr:hypothetical protein [Cellulomonas algicola]